MGECPHIVMDLYDLLLQEKILGCRPCNIHPKLTENIKREQFYKKLVTSINEKAFICSYIADHVFHAYEEGLQDRARGLLKKYNILEQVIKNSNQEEICKHFCEQIGNRLNLERGSTQLSLIKILKLHLFCLINCQKIIIPVMLSGCLHLECYEFTNLLQLCEDNKIKDFPQKSRRCFHHDCSNTIPLDLNELKTKLLFPQQVAETISKEYSFALSLNWDYNTHKFTYDKDVLEDNDILKDFSEYLEEDQNHIYIFQSYRRIVNKELSEDLNNKLKFTTYTISVKGIVHPVRCLNCPLNQCLDLRDFLFSEINQMNQNRYKPSFTCPVCNSKFDDYKQLVKVVYFDPYLAKSISLNKSAEQIEQNKFCEFQQYFCLSQSLTFQQVKQTYLREKRNPYENQHCNMDPQQIMKDPVVVIPNCASKRAFQFSNFEAYLQSKGFLFSDFCKDNKCSCSFCKNREFHLTDFYFDEFYGNLLNRYPQAVSWQNNITKVLQKHFQDDGIYEIPKLQVVGLQSDFSLNFPPPQQQPFLYQFQNQQTVRQNTQFNNFMPENGATTQRLIPQYRDFFGQDNQQQYQPPNRIIYQKYERINGQLQPVIKK